MTAGAAPFYNNRVLRVGSSTTARAALAAVLFCAIAFGFAPRVQADPAPLSVGTSPILNVFARHGKIIIRTWNRNQVQVEGDATLLHVSADRVAKMLPSQLPARAQTLHTRAGDLTLPPESFVLPVLPAVPHDGVIVRANGDVTLDMPVTTALVMVHVGFGRIVLRNYHGAFYTMIRGGGIALRNVSGTGFAQALRGYVNASNSTFDRLRVRTGTGNAFFERCTSRQIVVTSVNGSIVYDNGSFVPGLARFESQRGNVALGIGNGGAQISAHSGAGRIASEFTGHANVVNRTNDATASFSGGGATVTASSGSGAVLLYDGSLRSHPALVANLPRMKAMLHRHLRRAPPPQPARRIGPQPVRRNRRPPG